ncbi:MAG: EAL domain-containing protein [Erythrobacter sp.]|uniref:putative bifunctional diguanylate cyclase/phosphodiesterase n=1 Tax=Erythrobacter sp. TaxID=1042 RepID=UPI003C74580E
MAIKALLACKSIDAGRSQVHAITGLPAREALLDQMAMDAAGTLIVVACRDYDRLCTFDPSLGERVLLTIVARLRAMVPSTRMIAQIDRAYLAVWLGPDASDASAEAEAQALTYALSDRLIEGDREILPEIALRTARFDAANGTPHATVSGALSSFAVAVPGKAGHLAVDPELVAITQEQFAVEQDLRQAIARNELHMVFQPLLDADKGRVCGAEALIRWKHRTRGNIPPGQFIPMMEAAGITRDISLWALNHALREARGWRVAGFKDLQVAVNLSGKDLEVEALPQLIERTLARHGLAPDALEIELTESVALADGDFAAGLCNTLRSMGIKIAIDDFGTGYSSLDALRSLTFHKLKIDRSFVTDVDRRRDSQAICSALLALGRGLGIRVLAEGVETAAEYAWLRAHGCRFFQGYYLSRPLSAKDFVTFVRNPAQLAHLLDQSSSLADERLRA